MLPGSSSRRLVILTGARQTGKTTLARKLYPELRYINLDAPEDREAIRGVITARWLESVGNAVIDEAQKEPSVFEKVKHAYDLGKVGFTLFLGSSQILLLKHIRESLAGRVFIYELWPLMMSELLINDDAVLPQKPFISTILSCAGLDRCLENVPDSLFGEEEARLKEAQEYLLKWGGMPELLYLNDGDRNVWLRSYEYTYLERDLSDLARLNDLEPFKKFQRLSALRSGQLLTYSDLARDAGVSPDTARRYLEYLRLSYQVFLLSPFSRNLTSQVVKSPKLYWVDIGLLRQLSGFKGETTGELFETMVVSEIYKWIKSMAEEAELFFYRTRSGLEVDLLIQTKQGIIGVEVKCRDNVYLSDCRPMREIALRLGEKWLGGICIYRGRRIVRLGEPSLWAIPAHRLFG